MDDSFPDVVHCDRCLEVGPWRTFTECQLCGPVPLCGECADTHRAEIARGEI